MKLEIGYQTIETLTQPRRSDEPSLGEEIFDEMTPAEAIALAKEILEEATMANEIASSNLAKAIAITKKILNETTLTNPSKP